MNGDTEYREWLLACAKTCRCCPDCQQVPCDGCQQGGFCDAWCTCDDEPDEDWGEDDEEAAR